MASMTYFEIPDELWEKIESLFKSISSGRPGGHPDPNFRLLLSGILYRLKTGCQWHMIPRQYGSKSSLHEQYQRWVRHGIFKEILKIVSEEFDSLLGFDFEWQAMDGTLIQAPVRKKTRVRGTGRKPNGPGPQWQQNPSTCG